MFRLFKNEFIGGFLRRLGGFLAFLLIAILFSIFLNNKGYKLPHWLRIMRVNASTTTSWSTAQVKVGTCHDDSCSYGSNYDTPKTFSSTDIQYPVYSLRWRVKTTNGLSSENTYTFSVGYKATPDALGFKEIYLKGNGDVSRENALCQRGIDSSDYIVYKCTFTPLQDYSSSDYLYITIDFYQAYLTELKAKISKYEERVGTNAVITQQTDKIIQQNEQNTQDIINNNNQNTQDIINSNKVCKTYDISKSLKHGVENSRLSTNGNTVNYSGWFISDYIVVNDDSVLTFNRTGSNNQVYCFYNENHSVNSCKAMVNNGATFPLNVSIPSGAKYIRFSMTKNYAYTLGTLYTCENGNQSVTDSLTDDSVDDPSSSFSDMQDMLPTNGTITQLIALPITLYQKVLNSINGTCQQFDLGSLYGTNLIIPCIEVSNYLGSSIWNTIDLIISGAFVLIIGKKMIKAFENFTSMKEGDVIND